MKRYIYPILLLSIAGALISGILLYQHYFPEADILILSCGKGLQNSCITVGQSEFATFFGFPNAGIGLFFYFVFIFLILIADYAKNSYYDFIRSILFLLIIPGLVIDIILGILLIKIGAFCSLCVSTYAINIILFILLLHWQRRSSMSVMESIKKLVSKKNDNSYKRAASASLVLFFIMLFIALFSSVRVLQLQSSKDSLPRERVIAEVTNFYKTKPEKVQFPENGIILGNPNAKITIYAFTDFLCSACYAFYNLEKYFLIKYKNKIKVVYYHYPLDNECNSHVKESIYPQSCIASRAVFAAQKLNITTEYIVEHFNRYASFGHQYSVNEAMTTFRKTGLTSVNETMFYQVMDSKETKKLLRKHIHFADSLKIDATPTLYIADRKMVGFPPKDIFEEIIKQEIKKYYK